MQTLTSAADLMMRHAARFKAVGTRTWQEAIDAETDLRNETHRLIEGGSNPGRPADLREADYPFAVRHGAPLWPTPPVGSITGRLSASLDTRMTITNGTYSISAFSSGVDYARFIFSREGTEKMLPRHVTEAAEAFAEARATQAGRNIMAFQMRII